MQMRISRPFRKAGNESAPAKDFTPLVRRQERENLLDDIRMGVAQEIDTVVGRQIG